MLVCFHFEIRPTSSYLLLRIGSKFNYSLHRFAFVNLDLTVLLQSDRFCFPHLGDEMKWSAIALLASASAVFRGIDESSDEGDAGVSGPSTAGGHGGNEVCRGHAHALQ